MKTIEERAKEYAKGRRYEIVAYVAYIAGAIGQNDIDIDKACEWLKNNWREYVNQDRDGMILFGHWESDFRKAMEE